MSFHQNSSHWVPGLLSFKPLSLSFFTTFQLHCHPPKPPCQLPRRLSPATAAAARCGARHWPQRRRRQRRRRPKLWSEAAEGTAGFWWVPSHHQETQSSHWGLHFLALLFKNSNSNSNSNSNNNNNNNNNNHNLNLGKICIPPNLECKKENRSLYWCQRWGVSLFPPPSSNKLTAQMRISDLLFSQQLFHSKPSFFSTAHVDRVTWGPTNHFRHERLVHPITLPTCAAKFFSGPKKFTEAWLKLCFMAISLAALAASSATWGKGRLWVQISFFGAYLGHSKNEGSEIRLVFVQWWEDVVIILLRIASEIRV